MLTKIHHVGVVVRSADAALALYRDGLGMPVTKDAVLEDQGVRGVLLAAGDGEVELLEPTRPQTGVARFLESRGEGPHHLCFATDDIEAEMNTARARGLPLIDEQPRQGLAGMIAFLRPQATRGVLVEYAQPPAATGDRHDGGVQELDHVVAAVTDLDAGARAFEHNFALRESSRNEVPALGIRNVNLPIGRSYVELITPLSSDGPVSHFLQSRGEGLYLISLRVADLDATVTRLRERGVRASNPSGAGGNRLSFISPRNAFGITIQLIERGAR